MDKQAVLHELRGACTHLGRARRLAVGDEHVNYDEGSEIVPENETALAIGHAANWIYHIRAALESPEGGEGDKGAGTMEAKEGASASLFSPGARLNVDTLGRVAYRALAEWLVRDGLPEGDLPLWEELGESAWSENRAVAGAVARATLDAAVEHLREDLRAGCAPLSLQWAQGYEDAIGALQEVTRRMAPAEPHAEP
jgi:hypothetical protein